MLNSHSTDQLTTEGNLVTSTDQLISTVSSLEVDYIYSQLGDLINEQFKPWYCKQIKRLGREQIYKLASVARADAKQNASRYFSTLLKRA